MLRSAAAFVAIAGGLAVSCGGPVKRPDGGVGLLPIGAAAPDVAGEDRDGEVVRLSALRGRAAVVFFYPKDESPGCTKEACAFRDAFDRYAAAKVTLFGVSRDSVESHREFAKGHALQFPLVSDESGAIERAYGVSSALGLSARVTFLVGADGKIAKVWPNVDPAIHADDVLAAAGGR